MEDLEKRVIIRMAGHNDAALIAVLASVTFYEAYFEQDESANLSEYVLDAFSLDRIREEIGTPGAVFFVAFQGGKAVGYAHLIENSPNADVSPGKIIELRRIYTLERVWASGIGKTLLEHCIEYGRTHGFDSLWLGVWEENKRARRFYEKFAFRRVGTLTFPYGDVVGTNIVLEMSLT